MECTLHPCLVRRHCNMFKAQVVTCPAYPLLLKLLCEAAETLVLVAFTAFSTHVVIYPIALAVAADLLQRAIFTVCFARQPLQGPAGYCLRWSCWSCAGTLFTERGTIVTVFIVCYALTSFVAGYVR